MVHIRLFLDGERQYSKITGPTGPLVYPALHVYIYTALYHLTDEGTNILRAQVIFSGLYLITLAVVLACYRRVGAPPWLLVPLALSKRLHSIFVLRLFNDCWAALGLWVAIYLLQRRNWAAGTLVWGLGLGVKMTLLLAAPGVGVVLLQGAGLAGAVWSGLSVLLSQMVLATPFLNSATGVDYFLRAFDFGRQFLFKWSVNWRFIGEDTFLSKGFAIGLLVVHVTLLLTFLQAKWIRPTASSLWGFVTKYLGAINESERTRVSQKISPTFVMDTVLGSMVIGLLCARSLHYQFYAYLGWATPYLLWRAGGGPVWVLVNWAVQEYSWLVFPSTDMSSSLVVLELAVQAMCALIAPPVDHIRGPMKKGVKSG
ncbi:hypothetical protein LTR84_005494 [Exophiala bonariae]|uniref:Dol-P-Man:Man(5)GlcNAc(2)-PP-Dol alpha-1,3-mannosyltransferase n=1 Tax=Exophiala bonariae TaxID=1690606 RepID=A0AAV9N3Z1_9EURO|nr:hypothetical protein LTR84_005494 [Exophiala bonariae]